MEKYINEVWITIAVLAICLSFFSLKYKSERLTVVIFLFFGTTGYNIYSYLTTGSMNIFWVLINIVIFIYAYLKYKPNKFMENVDDTFNEDE